MDNIRFVSKDIFNELPHVVESWWKIAIDVVDKVNSSFINNLTFSSGEWFDFSSVRTQSLRHGISIFLTWWILFIIVLLSLSLPLYLFHYRTQKRIRNLTSNIPGPLTLPILGNVTTFASSNLVQLFQKLVEAVRKYGPVVRFWMGNKLYIVISDAESIETILTSKAPIKKMSTVSKIANGSSAVEPDVEKWKIHRTIISSTFNNNVLDQFVWNFFENSLMLTQKLKLLGDGSNFDIYPFVCSCTLDIICETTMGTNVNNQIEGDHVSVQNLLHALEELGGTLNNPWITNFWIQNRKKRYEKDKEMSLKYLHEFVDKVITEKLTSRRNGVQQNRGKQEVEYVQWIRGREMCLLDLLIQDNQMTVEEMRDELCTLMVASTKVGVTCCYVLYLLGVYQEVQEKVFEEQEKIFGDDIRRAATTKDLCSMNYLEQVMKETLRLYPPAPFLFRTIEEDTQLENGYILPKDSHAVIFSYMTHRNSEYFPDPELFNPERFSSDVRPYSYIPFGGGRRICVAYKYGMMEAKMILSSVLRAFHVTTPGGVESLDKNLQAGILLTPANGFNVQMLPRPEKVIPNIFRDV